ncbi:MAG: hypothetical protein L3J09_06645 [Flavobacteriaceae bacterium]|nr:hypothetical protein [Flavobacteriaceae bacterium]
MQQLKTIDEILISSEGLQLYHKLILQLNKDFQRAAIAEAFLETIVPSELKTKLHEIVFDLFQNHNSEYLNLLYIIDVSEDKIKKIEYEDTIKITKQITYLILLREWQKVWFREKFK